MEEHFEGGQSPPWAVMPRKKETWKAKEEVVTGLGGGPECYAGWKVVEESTEEGRMGEHFEGGQSPPWAVMPKKKETWKAKEEVVTGLGGGHEGYAGWKVVREGAE
jgi:hypothetical protein